MTTPEQKAININGIIKMGRELNLDTNLISDGYHSFGELYEHRFTLFIALCKIITDLSKIGVLALGGPEVYDLSVWRSIKHSDGSSFEGWFILGIAKEKGEQITYHLPITKWDKTDFAETLDIAPEWDGHTSDDVLKRLKLL